MKHTEKFRLNIIENGDEFTPETINDNTNKVEEALDSMNSLSTEIQTNITNLDTRLQNVETGSNSGLHVYKGYYDCINGKDLYVELDFEPKVAIFIVSTRKDRGDKTWLFEAGHIRTDISNPFSISSSILEIYVGSTSGSFVILG